MGTVLIVTPDVDMKNYFDPPVNGDHYLVVRSPDELSRVIQELPDNEWERMSRNCRDWYRKPFVQSQPNRRLGICVTQALMDRFIKR